MFKPLWQHGRAICFADGWFEWKKEGDKKQPYFIYRADGQPVFMAAIGSTPFERGDEAEGFLIVTAAADQGLVDIHDRRPLVLSPEAAQEWMRQEISGKEASTCLLTLEIIDELKCVTRNLYSSDTIAPNYLHIIFNYEFLTIYYILFNHIGIFIIISGIRNNIFSLRSFIANPCQSP